MNRPVSLHAIMAGAADRRPFRVGRATIDPVSRDATWPGGQERLQPQTLKVLVTLVSRPGEVVTRDELVQLCWDGRIVGDDVINRSISLLRHFAEHAGGFEIETVSRAGYRLIESDLAASDAPKRQWMAAAAAAVVGIAGLTGWIGYRDKADSQGVPPTPSIAVMPFTAQANDPLVRQVALAAPGALSHMMAESGFAKIRDDSAGAAPSRGTDYVFSGTVSRMGGSVEATVQLVSKRDGTIAFAHDFSAPIARAGDLPDRIGATAAAELAWTGAQMVLDPREHLNPEVASELMNSVNLTIEDGNSLRAYQLARHAAELAPDSAMAQLTFAVQTSFSISSIPPGERAEALALARRAGDRALKLAPEFGDVYIQACRLHSPVRMIECDAAARHGLAVDSSSSYVPGFLGHLYFEAGRIDEAIAMARQSMANDPYKPAKLARMIRLLEVAGRADEAEREYRQATRLWPDSGRMRPSMLLGLVEAGNYAALARLADARTDAATLDVSAVKALFAAERGHDPAAARRACALKAPKPFTQPVCMNVLAELGDLDGGYAIARALYPAWTAPPGVDADQVWREHPEGYETTYLTAPAGKAMRADPRFLDLARKQGLLAYWRKDGLPDFCRPPHPEPVCARIAGG